MNKNTCIIGGEAIKQNSLEKKNDNKKYPTQEKFKVIKSPGKC